MRVACLIAALGAIVTSASANAAYIYTPGGSSIPAEGNSNVVLDNHDIGVHHQFFYSGSLFGDTPVTLTAITFRYDGNYSNEYTQQYDFNFGQDLAIRLGTRAGAPSTVFADNLGPNSVVALQGARTISSNVDAPAGQTKSFNISFVFDTPYLYDPTAGSLVIDMIVPSNDLYLTVDDVDSPDVARLYRRDTTSSTGLGPIDSAPVIRFTTLDVASAVPEPASWAMMLGGFGMIGGALRRRKPSVRFA